MDFLNRLREAYYVCTGKMQTISSLMCGEYKLQVVFMTDHIGIEAPKKDGDAGYDMVIGDDAVIPAKNALPINLRTYTKVKIPCGLAAYIMPRSSANKIGLRVQQAVIDEGYTGELFTFVYNDTDNDIILKKGDKMSQFVLFPRFCPPISVVDKLPETQRGESGFGSTNKP